jgi:hypothetical protein
MDSNSGNLKIQKCINYKQLILLNFFNQLLVSFGTVWKYLTLTGTIWAQSNYGINGIKKSAVARKYSVLTEIVDIFTKACKVCIHDEDVAETDFEYTFETPKGSRSGFGKPCAPPAAGHLETL